MGRAPGLGSHPWLSPLPRISSLSRRSLQEQEPESLKLDDLLRKRQESLAQCGLGGKAAGRCSAVDAGRSPARSWACGLDQPLAPSAPGLCLPRGYLTPAPKAALCSGGQAAGPGLRLPQLSQTEAQPGQQPGAQPPWTPPRPRRGLPFLPCSRG